MSEISTMGDLILQMPGNFTAKEQFHNSEQRVWLGVQERGKIVEGEKEGEIEQKRLERVNRLGRSYLGSVSRLERRSEEGNLSLEVYSSLEDATGEDRARSKREVFWGPASERVVGQEESSC